MLVGEYAITILGEDGRSHAELVQTAATGHPAVGDELILGGRLYVVERIRHEQDLDTGSSSRVYSHARLFVRPVVGPQPTSEPDDEPTTGRVLPLVLPPRGAVSSEILPASLIAVIVACGYRSLASAWRAERRRRFRLSREGRALLLDEPTPGDCWNRSRLAKQHYAKMVAAICDGRFAGAIRGSASSPVELRASQRTRPTLRLLSPSAGGAPLRTARVAGWSPGR